MTFDLLAKDDMFRRRPPSSGLVQLYQLYKLFTAYCILFYDAFGISLRLHY
jgi:hypothetical protein